VSCHCEFNIPYDPYDQKEADIVREVVSRASEELAKHGAFFSRPYGDWVDIAFKKDVQETIVLKKIKEIFDPSNILNPGKLCF
jgi:FAD/FMN-containing dehydrogenase